MTSGPVKKNASISAVVPSLVGISCANAEIIDYGGSLEALPHEGYIHVVGEDVSPVMQNYNGEYPETAQRIDCG